MSLYKEHKVVRSQSGEVLEEFSTPQAAEEFMIMMQAKGESVRIVTDKEDADQSEGFEISGMDIEEPTIDFGSDLDAFNEDSGFIIENDNDDVEIED
jgi:hypothetical protein